MEYMPTINMGYKLTFILNFYVKLFCFLSESLHIQKFQTMREQILILKSQNISYRTLELISASN